MILAISYLMTDNLLSRFDIVVNTAGLLAEDLCLSLAREDGRVVSALIQPPGFKE